ncbi:hypothetical protein L3X38_032350 [Prunus dulcis]|uniref:Uncharacterized protein n=1 Tax=Prunus dulcis TaxID=3755 RepID=A0AAD4VEY6_PRUDU|nr:hypothetical protein L3X38_032350 [Prunus dulcis]
MNPFEEKRSTAKQRIATVGGWLGYKFHGLKPTPFEGSRLVQNLGRNNGCWYFVWCDPEMPLHEKALMTSLLRKMRELE